MHIPGQSMVWRRIRASAFPGMLGTTPGGRSLQRQPQEAVGEGSRGHFRMWGRGQAVQDSGIGFLEEKTGELRGQGRSGESLAGISLEE